MSTDSDLIAAFLAKKGVTKIETGYRAMDERRIRDLAHGNDQQREIAKAEMRDGEAEFETAQQEAWLARYEGWKAETGR